MLIVMLITVPVLVLSVLVFYRRYRIQQKQTQVQQRLEDWCSL
jgi:uncharacterized membrane protein YGL010W